MVMDTTGGAGSAGSSSTTTGSGSGMGESTETAGTLGSSAGGGGFDLGMYTEAIDDSIDGWYGREGERRQALADDPCRFAIDATTMLTDVWIPALNTAEQNAAIIADASFRAVVQAADNWGRPSSRYAGVDSFAKYLVDQNAFSLFPGPAFMFPANPIGAIAVQVELVDDLLPLTRPPLGTRSSDRGVRLVGSNDIWLRNGRLRGNELRQYHANWMDRVRADVWDPTFPFWRAQLMRLTGRSRTGWSIWRAGDAFQGGSRIAQLAARNDEVRSWIAAAEVDCNRQRAGLPPVGGPPSESGGGGMGLLLLVGLIWLYTRRKR